MADFPFSFGQRDQQTPEEQSAIQRQLGAFLGDPRGQGALLSAGLALMQPRGFGQTGVGQIGQAIGAGGESVRANELLDLKQAEQDRKQQDAESRALVAESRAGAAGARSGEAATRLELAREKLSQTGEQLELGRYRATERAKNDLQRRYNEERALIIKDNAAKFGENPTPIPTYGEFLRRNPQLAAQAGETVTPAHPPGTVVRQGGVDYTVGPNGEYVPVQK